jgi:hypothetical protein
MRQPSSHARAPAQQRITRLLQALLLLLTVSSCGLQDSPNAGLTPPMPVQPPLRKQVLQGYMPFGSIGWVNNELVSFSGKQINRIQKDALYVWDQKNKPRLLLTNSPGGCISDGTIRGAQLFDEGKVRYFQLEAPKFALRPAIRSHAPPKSKFEPVSCTRIATPVVLEEHRWAPLRKGMGFLDFGPRADVSGVQAVSHLAPDLQTRHDTGIRMETPMLPMAVHAAHDDSYLVFDLNLTLSEAKDWIQSNKRTIWRLDREQRGEAVTLPAGPWVGLRGGTISFLPSRPGVLITTKNFSRDLSAGGAGLYLLRPGAPAQRLERGLVEEAAVSPDGCRIAYGFRPRLDTGLPEGGPRLVVVDLCGVTKPAKR